MDAPRSGSIDPTRRSRLLRTSGSAEHARRVSRSAAHHRGAPRRHTQPQPGRGLTCPRRSIADRGPTMRKPLPMYGFRPIQTLPGASGDPQLPFFGVGDAYDTPPNSDADLERCEVSVRVFDAYNAG